MAEDRDGLSPSELMLRSARGDDAARTDLDFELPGTERGNVGSREYATESGTSAAMSAEEIAAELAAQNRSEADTLEPAPPTSPAREKPVSTSNERVETVQETPMVAPSDPWSEPTAEWLAREAALPKRREPILAGSRSWIRLATAAIALGVVGFGLIGAQLDGKEPVESLAVGDCFVAGPVEEIDQVPVVDCSEPHDSEVMASVEITGFGSQYPGEDSLFDALFDDCVTRFPSYVGESFETSSYYIDTWIPLLDGWNDGDRTGLCTVVQVDGNFDIVSITGSAKDSARNA